MSVQNPQPAALIHDILNAQIPTQNDQQIQPHGSINPVATQSNVYSDEASTAARSQVVIPEARSNSPTEHTMDELSNNNVHSSLHPLPL